MPEEETTLDGQIPFFCVLRYYQWEFHACSLARYFFENLVLNPISNCGFFLNPKWKWLGRKKKNEPAVVFQLFKYVFSKYPILSTVFFFFQQRPHKICFAIRMSSSPLRQMKIAKHSSYLYNRLLWSKHSPYLYNRLLWSCHYPKKIVQKLSPKYSYVDIWLAFFTFLIVNFGMSDIHKETDTRRKRILVASVWGCKTYLAQVKELRKETILIFYYFLIWGKK